MEDVVREIASNGNVTVSIDTLCDLLDKFTGSETIKKSDIREIIEGLEELE